jgi:hypothetical protein
MSWHKNINLINIWLYILGKIPVKPRLHEQILFDKFHMSKYFARVDDTFVTNLLWLAFDQMHLSY